MLLCFIISADNEAATIQQLKLFINKEDNSINWEEAFSEFLTNEIINTNSNIVQNICMLRPLYYNDCITSSFGFYNTALGTRNTLDLIKDCKTNPKDICSMYQKILSNNLAQLKYILRMK